jgi:hypothetical protein
VIRCYTWRIARFLLQPKLCINDRQHACSTTPFRRRVGVGVVVVASVSPSSSRRCRGCCRCIRCRGRRIGVGVGCLRIGIAAAVVASVSRLSSLRQCRRRRIGVAVVIAHGHGRRLVGIYPASSCSRRCHAHLANKLILDTSLGEREIRGSGEDDLMGRTTT